MVKKAFNIHDLYSGGWVLCFCICNYNSRFNLEILKRYLEASDRFFLPAIPSILIIPQNPAIYVCKSRNSEVLRNFAIYLLRKYVIGCGLAEQIYNNIVIILAGFDLGMKTYTFFKSQFFILADEIHNS
jgi:hypothetical protein